MFEAIRKFLFGTKTVDAIAAQFTKTIDHLESVAEDHIGRVDLLHRAEEALKADIAYSESEMQKAKAFALNLRNLLGGTGATKAA